MRRIFTSALVPAAALALAVGACASPSGPPADRIVYRTDDATAPALDSWPAQAPEATQDHRQPLDEMSESERRAWFESQGIFPYLWYPEPEGQNLGYVRRPTNLGWVTPAVLTAGALYGLYRLKRHYDWW